ncbi:MAG: ECF transporter S component, partial [Anaerovorax sp.]
MKNNITELCETGIFAAVIFIATFTLKIPTPFTEGYTHLGDCMIFTAVVLLGVKRGAIAGGIGAGLADLIGGFGVWVLPTVIFKSLMAVCMGTIIQRQIIKGHPRMLFLLGAVTGGIVQSVGYVLVRAFLYGTPAA